MTARKTASDAFLQDAGWGGAARSVLAGDASNRRYDRLVRSDGQSAILMNAPADRGENVRPFMRIAHYLVNQGLSAPRIYAADPDHGFLLIEDLGDALFARLMAHSPDRARPLYQAATDVLVALHKVPPIPLDPCDAAWLTRMCKPAFEWYLQTDGTAALARFEAAFSPLAAVIDGQPKVVILRDYHAENLLWLPDRKGGAKVGLLDFQDALLGHPAYDLVSILQDARRDVPSEIEAAMIARYLAQSDGDPAAFHAAYALLGAQRNLRILGIFARLCLRDGKAHYIDLIPRVWGYVLRNLEHPALAPLAKVVLCDLPEPTAEFLEDLRSRCATNPMP